MNVCGVRLWITPTFIKPVHVTDAIQNLKQNNHSRGEHLVVLELVPCSCAIMLQDFPIPVTQAAKNDDNAGRANPKDVCCWRSRRKPARHAGVSLLPVILQAGPTDRNGFVVALAALEFIIGGNQARRTGVKLGSFQDWQGVIKPPKLRLQDGFPVGPVQAIDTLNRARFAPDPAFKLCVSSGRAGKAACGVLRFRDGASLAGETNGAIVRNDAEVPRFARQRFALIGAIIFAVESASDGENLADDASQAR